MNSTHFLQSQLLMMPLGLLGSFINVQLKISAPERLHVEMRNEICFQFCTIKRIKARGRLQGVHYSGKYSLRAALSFSPPWLLAPRPPVPSADSSPLLVHNKKQTPSNIEGTRVHKHTHARREAVADSACGFDWCD